MAKSVRLKSEAGEPVTNAVMIKIKSLKQLLALSNKGATLIELLIALALLSIMSATFLSIITDSVGLRGDSDLIKQASAIATSKVEAIKATDVPPVDLIQVENTSEGFTIQTAYIEKSAALALTDASLPQVDTSFYNTPVFELTFDEAATGHYQGTQITSVDFSTLTDYKFQLIISEVAGSTNLLRYDLVVNTNTGVKTIQVGSQTLSNATYKAGRIIVGPKLTHNIELTVVDQVGEHLQIGLFNDSLNRVQTHISGVSPAVRIESGLLTQAADNQLGINYYDVVVTVSKNGREYARVLTTWAVGK